MDSTYKTATDKQDRNGNMLQVLSAPRTVRGAQVLKEDVGRAIDKDESAFHELGRWAPLMRRLWAGIPSPPQLRETARPTTQGEEPKPKEDATLDPMSQPTEYFVSLLESS